jgi:hypothetical protein
MTDAQKRAANAEKRRNTRHRWIREGRCENCGSWSPVEGKTFCDPCLVIRRRAYQKYSRGLRSSAWDAYGGPKCNCCGETEEMFLTIDHVDNDGANHRREIEAKDQASKFYLWLRRAGYPAGFQVLCQNCNVGKWRNGGTCPHESARGSELAGSEDGARPSDGEPL